MKKILSLVLALLMVLGTLSALADHEVPYYEVTSDLYEKYPTTGEPIRLEVYSQLANYNGL